MERATEGLADGPSRYSISHFFCPAPARLECASEETWGSHRIQVEIPAPLKGARPSMAEHILERDVERRGLYWVELLSHRLNALRGEARLLGEMTNPSLLRHARVIAPAALQDISTKYYEIARSLGCAATARSSFCWLGAGGPVDSYAVFGPAELIAQQMEDVGLFIDENRGRESPWFFEAIAYQLLMIHPLSDGNGRTVRSIVIGLHRRSGSIEPLYIFWRLKFCRRQMFDQWKSARVLGALCCHGSESLVRWQERAVALNDAFGELLTKGLAKQAVTALCLHGEVSVRSVTACDSGLGGRTACRIVDGWKAWYEADCGKELRRLEGVVASLTEALN